MRTIRRLAIALLVPFTALTAYAMYDVGYLGVLEHQLASSGGVQVLVDLAIAVSLILLWLVPHAARTGRNPWPYIIITLVFASLGPLLYLALTRPDAPGPGDAHEG